MALARTSSGKHSPTVRYAALAAHDAKKKFTDHNAVCATGPTTPSANSHPVTAISTPDIAYVLAIITLRPTMSNRCPSNIGPMKLPTANGSMNQPTDGAGTP